MTALIMFLRAFSEELKDRADLIEAPSTDPSVRAGSATWAAATSLRAIAGAIEAAMKKTLLA